MLHRTLGSTGIRVSTVAFGAGPVSGLLTGADGERQLATVRHAVESGINWFDTAATYGEGQSEQNLGDALRQIDGGENVHIATKVRLMPDELSNVRKSVRASVTASLRRLRRERVTLLQLHNSLTPGLGDLATSLTPAHVLSPGGVLEAMQDLQRDGLVAHLGITALGDPRSLREVIHCGALATIQVPFNLLNPSAGRDVPNGFAEDNFGNIIAECASQGMGTFAIRVLAGGAMAGHAPSAHTHKTKFFPLDLYQRDQQRAGQLAEHLPPGVTLPEAAVRFVLGHSQVSAAIIGFSSPEEIDASLRFAAAGPLPAEVMAKIQV